jgi:spore coat protein CotH
VLLVGGACSNGVTATDTNQATTTVEPAADADTDADAVGTLASAEVHEISVTFDTDDYEAMLATYASTEEKEWIEATVTIDGVTYEQVGMRLKGNSSLRGLAGDGTAGDTTSETPESLPWLVKLDEFVEDQNHEGLTELVIRANNSATALNEAVALELLELAGLASQDAVAARVDVNGSEPVLRLVIENPDDAWMAEVLDASGALYKAESTGDYSYRGDDPESYDEVFDQEAGKDNTDLTPLIDFLQFINESDNATFEAELEQWLDLDAFATYLAMQELLDNFDDIDGPGNNSYLFYDSESEQFTVVPWDYNLAFGMGPGGARGPGGGMPAPGEQPATGDAPTPGDLPVPDGAAPPPFDEADGTEQGARPGGFGGRTNVLVERFLAVDAWQQLYEQRIEELRAELYDSGVAEEVLARWVDVVEGSGLVESSTISSEADQIASAFS